MFGAWTWASNSRKWTRFMIDNFTVSAVGLLEEGRAHTLVTSMFSHRCVPAFLYICTHAYLFRLTHHSTPLPPPPLRHHSSFGHLLVNAITLYFFGAEAAILLGVRKFVALYLTGGLASSLCCVAWPYVAPKLDIPASYRVSKWTVALGASGELCVFSTRDAAS